MKTKNLPKEIRMFSKVYKIEYLKNLNEVDTTGESLLFGRIDFKNNSVRIYNSDDYSYQDVIHILFHELLHAIKLNLGINFQTDEDEKIIDQLALSWMHICVENHLDFSGKP